MFPVVIWDDNMKKILLMLRQFGFRNNFSNSDGWVFVSLIHTQWLCFKMVTMLQTSGKHICNLNFLLTSKKGEWRSLRFFSKRKLEILQYVVIFFLEYFPVNFRKFTVSTGKIRISQFISFLMKRMLAVQSALCDLFYTPIWFYLRYCSVLGYALRYVPCQIWILIGKLLIELWLLSTLYLFSHLYLVTITNIFYFRHPNTNVPLSIRRK